MRLPRSFPSTPPAESRIQKGFPRSAWLKKYGSILNLKVRTDFFEQMSIFLICSVVCQFHIVFQKLFRKFEPIIRFLFKSCSYKKRKSLRRRKFAEAQVFKRDKPSRLRRWLRRAGKESRITASGQPTIRGRQCGRSRASCRRRDPRHRGCRRRRGDHPSRDRRSERRSS